MPSTTNKSYNKKPYRFSCLGDFSEVRTSTKNSYLFAKSFTFFGLTLRKKRVLFGFIV